MNKELEKEKSQDMTFSDLIRQAATKDDLGLGEITQSPGQAVLQTSKQQSEEINQAVSGVLHRRFKG